MSLAGKGVNEHVLYQEHLYLGGTFGDGTFEGLSLPERYATLEEEVDAFSSAAALSDLSGTNSLLISGGPAQAFAEAAFSGKKLAVGECAFEAVLGGDGTLMSVPLLARTGDAEYVLWDPSARFQLLASWLEFLHGVSKDDYAPYDGVELENVTGRLVPLSLWGPAARHVLGDYVSSSADLPGEGRVRDVRLDSIPTVVAYPPTGDTTNYLLLVPPAYAVTIWRSLLSFHEVSPAGARALVSHLESTCPWMPWMEDTDKVMPARTQLADWGLTRPETDFVGGRAI